MYQHLTKLLLAGMVAVALLALGSTSIIAPAWADDDSDDVESLEDLSCKNGQIAKRDGSRRRGKWVCADDTDTLAGLTCSQNQVAKFNGVSWACADDENTTIPDTDTLADLALTCIEGDVAKFDGIDWVCAEASSGYVVRDGNGNFVGRYGDCRRGMEC